MAQLMDRHARNPEDTLLCEGTIFADLSSLRGVGEELSEVGVIAQLPILVPNLMWVERI
jgi:hypothetical protein